MFDTILLPIDLNHRESWEKALPMAQHCAGSTGRIHVLGIVPDPGSALVASFLPKGFEKKAMAQLKADLRAFATRELSEAAAADVHVGYGHVAETVLKVAKDNGADLIVMASHPPNDLSTFLIGSQADRVVRHATLPVLVVR